MADLPTRYVLGYFCHFVIFFRGALSFVSLLLVTLSSTLLIFKSYFLYCRGFLFDFDYSLVCCIHFLWLEILFNHFLMVLIFVSLLTTFI